MNLITLQQLIDADACADQRYLFKQKFGDSVEVTRELCISVADVFDWSWAAQHFLSAPALKVYHETYASAWNVYDETCAPALKVYDETRAQAWKVYNETRAPAWKVYDETCAAMFATAFEIPA